jgi:hypothetical protein
MADLPFPRMRLALARFQRGMGSLALRPVLIPACEEAGILTPPGAPETELVLGDTTVSCELRATHDQVVREGGAVGATSRRHRHSISCGGGSFCVRNAQAAADSTSSELNRKPVYSVQRIRRRSAL